MTNKVAGVHRVFAADTVADPQSDAGGGNQGDYQAKYPGDHDERSCKLSSN